jgi:hypothetical protein
MQVQERPLISEFPLTFHQPAFPDRTVVENPVHEFLSEVVEKYFAQELKDNYVLHRSIQTWARKVLSFEPGEPKPQFHPEHVASWLLLELVKHTDPEVRKSAARAFAGMPYTIPHRVEDKQQLIKTLIMDDDLRVRHEALKMLKKKLYPSDERELYRHTILERAMRSAGSAARTFAEEAPTIDTQRYITQAAVEWLNEVVDTLRISSQRYPLVIDHIRAELIERAAIQAKSLSSSSFEELPPAIAQEMILEAAAHWTQEVAKAKK